jgi:hypothetical protein
MDIRTLIIGFTPITDTAGKKSRQLRDDTYFKELLGAFDLGEVYFASYQDWKQKADEVNPLFIVTFDDYFAREIQEYKKDALLYVTYDAGQIFYRKAEIEKKKAEQQKTFTEIARLVKDAKEGDEKHFKFIRQFAAMSYDDMYKMIVKAIIGEDEGLRKKAWALLTDNNVHSNFLWMRVQLLGEVWDHCDGKGKEEFLLMAMDQHIENGIARKMENFWEGEQEFHQYMWVFFDGTDTNYIRRIPVGFKKQDKYAYLAILDKFETPTGIQIMLEAGQMRTKKAEWAKDLCEKFAAMLKVWKEDPKKSMKELGVIPWYPYTEDDALVGRELEGFKEFLKKHDKASFDALFSI